MSEGRSRKTEGERGRWREGEGEKKQAAAVGSERPGVFIVRYSVSGYELLTLR